MLDADQRESHFQGSRSLFGYLLTGGSTEVDNQTKYLPNWAETTLLKTCTDRFFSLSFVTSGKSLLFEYTIN